MSENFKKLVNIGLEGSYITNVEGISYFKTAYKRHSGFYLFQSEQSFGSPGNFGKKVSANISKISDLLGKIYLVIDLPNIPIFSTFSTDILKRKINKAAWAKKIGFALIKSIEIEIGGNIIDKHSGDWLNIWSELSVGDNINNCLDKMIGNVDKLTTLSNYIDSYRLYIPLYFWFCKDYIYSVPLLSLTHSDIKINIEFNEIQRCLVLGPSHYIYINDATCSFELGDIIYQKPSYNKIIYAKFIYYDPQEYKLYYIKQYDNTDNTFVIPTTSSSTNSLFNSNNIINESLYAIYNSKGYNVIPQTDTIEYNYIDSNKELQDLYNLTFSSCFLLVDNIVLNEVEREKIAIGNNTYIIETLQYENDYVKYNANLRIPIGYDGLCKEFIVVCQLDSIYNSLFNDVFNYTDSIYDHQGNNIVKSMKIIINDKDRIEKTISSYFSDLQIYQFHTKCNVNGINCYSFSLYPECVYQPSGAINLSVCNNIYIDLSLDPSITYNKPVIIRVYALKLDKLNINKGVGYLQK